MADTKLTALASATPALGDLAYIVDVSDATDDPAGSSRKTTLQSALDSLGVPYSTDGGSSVNCVGDFVLPSAKRLAWGTDAFMQRDAANVIALRNGANATAFLTYNTYTDASNYERAGLRWNANIGYFAAQQAGTGTLREVAVDGAQVYFATSTTLRWVVSSAGHLFPIAANSYDVGASGFEPRSVYALTSVELGGSGWVRNSPGIKRLSANVTNATATLSSGVLSDLTVTLVAGRKYAGLMAVRCSDSVAADGIQLDFNAGTATMTNFNAGVVGNAQGATAGTTVSAALATALSFTAMSGTGDHWLLFAVSLVCNAGGTLIPRVAQNAHSTGTATAALGSWLALDDSP